MFCQHCGTPIPQNARECPNCHLAVPGIVESNPPGYAAQTVMIHTTPPIPEQSLPPTQQQEAPSFAAPTMIMGATPPAYVPPMQAPSAPVKKKMKPALIVVIVLAVMLLCCLVTVVAVYLLQPAWLPFDLPKLGGGGGAKESSDTIVGYLQSDTEYNLAWVHGKNEDLLYEDAILDTNYNGISYVVDGAVQEYLWNSVDFLPTDPGKLLVRVMDDDDTVVSVRDLKKETEVELFKSNNMFSGYLLQDGTFVFVENRSESVRAYVSDGKTEAERVLKADVIFYQPSLNQFLAYTSDADETTYQLYDLHGNELATLYQGETLSNYVINADGSLMALVQPVDEGVEVLVIDTRNGEVLSTINAYTNIAGLFTAPLGKLIYIYGEDEDGFLNLEATTNGEWVLLAEGAKRLAAVTHLDTTQMAFIVTDEDDTNFLYVADAKTGESQVVLESDDALNVLSETKIADTFFASEVIDGETTLYRCSFRGGEPIALIEDSESAISYLTGINGVMVLSLYDSTNNTNSFWVIPKNAQEGYPLMEDWYSLYVVATSPDGSQLILNGTEDSGDDPILYKIDVQDGAKPEKIDDDFQSIWNAFYTSDGESLLYNVQIGDRYDDYEVRRIALRNKDAEIETIYEEARIIATGWTTFDYDQYWYAYSVYATQGSGVSRLGVGQTASGSLGGDIYETRFKASLETDRLYRIVVNGAETVNPAIYVYDKDGMQLVYKNDYANAEESLFFAPSVSGAYEFGVTDWNYSTAASKFTIELVDVPVAVLTPGQTLTGEMTSADIYQFGGQPQYLRFYLVPAKANDYLTITVDGFGTDVPFGATLYDSFYTYQTGTYGYGYAAILYYSVYYDTRYILAVTDDSSFYGMTVDFNKDHSFTVNITQ